MPSGSPPLLRDISRVLGRIAEIDIPIRDYIQPQRCPADLLPWLAWDSGVEQWSSQWSEERKRDVIAAALDSYKVKGTLGAIKRVCAQLDYSAVVQEWFSMSPPGAPYTFGVSLAISQTGLSGQILSGLRADIDRAKNLRSRLTGVRITVVSAMEASVLCAVRIGRHIHITNTSEPIVVLNEFAICI